jgi:hypothetical protein
VLSTSASVGGLARAMILRHWASTFWHPSHISSRAGLVTPTHRRPQRRRHANRARNCVAAPLRRATGHHVQRRIDTSKPTAGVRDPQVAVDTMGLGAHRRVPGVYFVDLEGASAVPRGPGLAMRAEVTWSSG